MKPKELVTRGIATTKGMTPTSPICDQERKRQDNFLSTLAAPARRALAREGIATLKQLATFTEKELLQLHGVEPSSMPTLRRILQANGFSFKS